MTTNNKHHSLVLSGGGAKGAFQVGVMSEMAGRGYEFDSYGGVSVGAINAAYLAQFDSFKEGSEHLEQLWLDFETKDVYKKWFLWPVSVLWKSSLYNSEPLLKLLKKHISEENYKKPCVVGAVKLSTGDYKRIVNPTPREVHASAAFPAFMNGSDGMIDGGLRNITPLGDVIKEFGATRCTVIMAQSKRMPKKETGDLSKAHQVALRSIDIMTSEIMETDIKVASMYNILADNGLTQEKKYIDLDVHRPLARLNYDALDFSPKFIKQMIELGKKYARNRLQGISRF